LPKAVLFCFLLSAAMQAAAIPIPTMKPTNSQSNPARVAGDAIGAELARRLEAAWANYVSSRSGGVAAALPLLRRWEARRQVLACHFAGRAVAVVLPAAAAVLVPAPASGATFAIPLPAAAARLIASLPATPFRGRPGAGGKGAVPHDERVVNFCAAAAKGVERVLVKVDVSPAVARFYLSNLSRSFGGYYPIKMFRMMADEFRNSAGVEKEAARESLLCQAADLILEKLRLTKPGELVPLHVRICRKDWDNFRLAVEQASSHPAGAILAVELGSDPAQALLTGVVCGAWEKLAGWGAM
jgi:hypothetical protein